MGSSMLQPRNDTELFTDYWPNLGTWFHLSAKSWDMQRRLRSSIVCAQIMSEGMKEICIPSNAFQPYPPPFHTPAQEEQETHRISDLDNASIYRWGN